MKEKTIVATKLGLFICSLLVIGAVLLAGFIMVRFGLWPHGLDF
jgi:hypothetical protein